MKSRLGLILALILLPFVAAAQEERHLLNDSIEQILLKHPYRFSILRVAPKLLIDSGYDSNALGISNEALQPQIGDYYMSIVPGGSFALKLGRRGYFMVDEDVTFLYYKDLTQLRDTYGETTAMFVTGSRKLLLTAGGSYVKRKTRINTEFDSPARETLVAGYASLAFALRPRTDLTFDARVDDGSYERILGVTTPQPLPPDNRETTYGGGIKELFGRKLQFTFHAGAGHTDFANRLFQNERDRTHLWNFNSGFEFTSRQLTGHARAGYEKRESVTIGEDPLKNLSVDVDMNWLIRRHLTFGIFGLREQEPSNLTTQGFRLTTEGGATGSLPLAGRFFLDGKFTAGKNDYNGDTRIQKDNYREAEAALDFVLVQNLVLRGGVTHYNRDSDVLLFNKNRTTFLIGIRFELETQQAQP